MAINVKPSILGDLKGKIGSVVLTTCRGVDIAKSSPKKRAKGKNPVLQNSAFKMVNSFLKAAGKGMIKKGHQVKKKERLDPMNLATSYLMLNAVAGKYPDFTIDLTKVKFSRAVNTTETGWNAAFIMEEAGNLQLNWELNPYPEKTTQLDDLAVLVFYDSTAEIFSKPESIQRSTLGYTFPITWNNLREGHEINCWLFFTSADGKLVSETEYLGMIKL